jgi:hypothetical protein
MKKQFMLQVSYGVSSISAHYLPVVVVGSKFQQLSVVPPLSILAKLRHMQWSPLLVDLRWSFVTRLVALVLPDFVSFY